ncbi:vacuolar-type H+-ATPase subunit E/Vma4 [Rhizobium leguminosarum]|uniref:hypothetical protein n=1 Tax=Rhizobium leguminosarum TaxID=384 RepID=UPI00160A1FA1|nr:hypothetical protein [Rhizobium leguminosarum]MBB4585579.1 vacuolar-type H+-ATPase subunit E/Vma4 [Rhizobium leguminosarum]
MAKARLTDDEIERIVGLLTMWKGELSWDLLTERIESMLRRSFTRQGLNKQENILTAFQQAKARLRSTPPDPSGLSPELAVAQARIDSLVAEVGVLKAERDRLNEKFATWLYNARSRGISTVDLNRPLPEVDRDRSVKIR